MAMYIISYSNSGGAGLFTRRGGIQAVLQTRARKMHLQRFVEFSTRRCGGESPLGNFPIGRLEEHRRFSGGPDIVLGTTPQFIA